MNLKKFDNNLIKQKLNWSPTHPLKNGLTQTYNWISEQVKKQEAST